MKRQKTPTKQSLAELLCAGDSSYAKPWFATLRCGGKELSQTAEEQAAIHLYNRLVKKVAGQPGKKNGWTFRGVFEGDRKLGTRHLHLIFDNPRNLSLMELREVFSHAYVRTPLFGNYGRAVSPALIESMKLKGMDAPKEMLDIRPVKNIEGLADYLTKSYRLDAELIDSMPFTAWR